MTKLYMILIELQLHIRFNYKKYVAISFAIVLAFILFTTFTFANTELEIDNKYYYLTGNSIEVTQESNYFDFTFKYQLYEAHDIDGNLNYLDQYGSVQKDVYLLDSIQKANKQIILDNYSDTFYGVNEENSLVPISLDINVNGDIFNPNPYWYNNFTYIYFPEGATYIYGIKFITYYFD